MQHFIFKKENAHVIKMHFYCYSGAPNADAPDVYQFITLSPRTSMPQRRELWGELKLSSRPCSSTWTRGSTRYSEVCFSDKSIYMHTALMAQTTAFLVPGSSHSVTVTNLVILLFESQTRLAKDIQISVGEDSFTERLQAIPKQFRLEQWTVSRKVRSNQS